MSKTTRGDRLKPHKYRILITSTSFGKTDPLPLRVLEQSECEIIMNPYDRPLREEELIPLLKGVDGVIAGLDNYTAVVLESTDSLKVISRYGVGLNNVDLDAARRRGIMVTNTPDANTQAVADLTLGLLLAACRMIPQAHASMQAGKWERFMGYGVSEKNLGIIGLGRIGKAVAKRAAGFSMSIMAFDVNQDKSFARDMNIRFVSLDQLLAEADFVTLHCALDSTTRGLITARELGLMKQGSFLINTARGELVEEQDLYEALVSGRIAGAALDTYQEEPPRHRPLLGLPNIVTTPHMGAYTREALLTMGLASVANLIRSLRGTEGL